LIRPPSPRSVDSLLNYETVKYFNAEEARVRAIMRRSRAAMPTRRSNPKTRWALLNIGQSLITNLMMAGRYVLCRLGLVERGVYRRTDGLGQQPALMQLFRPLDMLGMVYRTIRQGLIDMAAMFDLIDTPPEIVDKPGSSRAASSGAANSPLRM
jgi:ABC-type transport system involved in Fe-S cluster assembly fused permease/ATPase subunit